MFVVAVYQNRVMAMTRFLSPHPPPPPPPPSSCSLHHERYDASCTGSCPVRTKLTGHGRGLDRCTQEFVFILVSACYQEHCQNNSASNA